MLDSTVERRPIPFTYPDAMVQLLETVRLYMSPDEIDQVLQAYRLAFESCQDVVSWTRPVPPLEQALAVTTIMAEIMHVDAIGISAGLVFEVVDAKLLALEQVERVLGLATARVVGSMARLNVLERKKQNVVTGVLTAIKNIQSVAARKAQKEHDDEGVESKKPRIREAMRRQQDETVRKMYVAMADDPRVVLLKLAYRLRALRMAIESGYQQEVLILAQEARETYAPLAGRLGMSRVEGEMEDLAFQILEPEAYNWVRDILEMERKQWRSYVEQVCGVLRAEMESIGVKAEISGRVKHAYSFYRKILRSVGDVEDFEALKAAADINQIHDLIAFRILVETTTDCYIALGHVHGLWKPKEGRIKDFIANPKPNGYSALHTTVFCLGDQLVEIQIRTHEMHEAAEYGVAMHWHYKDVGDHASASAKELLTWLRQLNEWQQELRVSNTSDADFVAAVKDEIFQEQIFVFTPKGDVKDLPVGSTPLDFAYRIHSSIGDHCAGARIRELVDSEDGERMVTRMVPLDYELKNGEIVEIVTSRYAHPTRDWLNVARTVAARNKIRRYLRTDERPMNIQIGHKRLDSELKQMGTSYSLEDVTEDAERWLCNECKVEAIEDLLAAIGADNLRPRVIAVKLVEYWQQRERKEAKDEQERKSLALPTTVSKKSTDAQLEVAGVNGLLTKLANCCNPLPGDRIVGFVSRGKGVVVHRLDCRNMPRYLKEHSERLINVNWLVVSSQHYHVPIIITAQDRAGLIRDVATAVSDVGANMLLVNTRVRRGIAVITATLEIESMDMYHRLCTKLERTRGVTHVERDLGKRR